MEKSASEAQALHRAGRKRAHLPVEGFLEMELLRELLNAFCGCGAGKVIEAAEKVQILAAGKPRIKAYIAAGVIAELSAHRPGIADGIVSCDLGVSPRGKDQSGKNSEQRGFTSPICAQQRQGLARTHLERNPSESEHGGLFERLQKGTPAATGRRKRFFEGFDANRVFGHEGIYNVSCVSRQSVSGARDTQLN
jgi:hypothetical protein